MSRDVERALDDIETRVRDVFTVLENVAILRRALSDIDQRVAEVREMIKTQPAPLPECNPRQLTLHMGDGRQLEFDLRTSQKD